MEITLVAVGMGDGGTLTREAAAALAGADAVLGASRLLEGLGALCSGAKLPAVAADEICALLDARPEWQTVCVVLSGDTGFYSGAAALQKRLAGRTVRTLCGVSSVQLLAARLGRPWQDFKLASLHGRDCDPLALALNHPAVFFLTDARKGAPYICQTLCGAGLGEAAVTVGENLAAPDERITEGTAEELANQTFSLLHVVLVENRRHFTYDFTTPGIPDQMFLRGKAPMTKQEVRAIALAKLGVCPDDVLFDVGAGTGSVAVELALQARIGRVYAIESEEEACALIARNREAFGAYHLQVVQGVAPAAFDGLPAPNGAFVGGSRGALTGIVQGLLALNPAVRMVVAAVTLETLENAMSTFKENKVNNMDVTQVSVSRGEALGRLTQLKPLNPVFLVAGGGMPHG